MAKRKARELSIEYMLLSEIKLDKTNPKDHDLGALGESLARFGFVAPMVLNERNGKLLAGHGRLKELQQLMREDKGQAPEGIRIENGTWLAPVVRGIDLAPKDGKAYVVADNRMVELGGWNDPMLMDRLIELAGDKKSGLTGTGFDGDDLDLMIRLYQPKGIQEPQEHAGIDPSVLERGPANVAQATAASIPLADDVVHTIVTSPPYWSMREYKGEQGDEPLGQEPTPELHIERMLLIFAELERVLRPDGVVWLNYADSHYKKGPMQGSLTLIPFMLVLALREAGWLVRQVPIWWKRNPMPEAPAGWRWQPERKEKARVKGAALQKGNRGSEHMMGSPDRVIWEQGKELELNKASWRHSTEHEYIFMLTRQMQYFANQEIVRELGTSSPSDRSKMVGSPSRNPRTVMDVTADNYRGAHFATFPPRLIEPFILATCPGRCCSKCGQAWAPIVDVRYQHAGGRGHEKTLTPEAKHAGQAPGPQGFEHGRANRISTVRGYQRTCKHTKAPPRPGLVYDPFMGSGTTGYVARSLGLRWVGTDISMEYLRDQARYRILSAELPQG